MTTKILANNNKAFVRKIARRSIRSSKLRTVMSLLAIMLAAALISGLALFTFGINEKSDRQLNMMQHVIYQNLTEKQCAEIRSDDRVRDALISKRGLASEMDGCTIQLVYTEQRNSSIAAEEIVEGRYPEKLHEAVVDKAYMKERGMDPKIGSMLTFRYYDGTEETFWVSGFTDTGMTGKNYAVAVSASYAESGRQLKDQPYMLAVKIAGAEQMHDDAFLAVMTDLGADYGVKRADMNENNRFVMSLGIDVNEMLVIAAVAIFVLFAGAVVVYSIFYISVMSRIRQFGQLLTLGAAPKQIWGIVKKEGHYMFVLGTPPGILAGCLFGYFTQPEGWLLRNGLLVSAAVLLLSYVMIMLSVRKPAKLAASISPIEAAKASGYETVSRKAGNRFRKMTPWGLARLFPARNRRKFVMTVLSLCVSGVIFIVGTTFLSSFDRMEFSRQGAMRYSEYQVGISQNAVNSHEQGLAGVQKHNPLTPALIEEICRIDGVKEVHPVRKIDVSFMIDNYSSEDSFVPFTRRQAEFLKSYMESGRMDYDAATEKKQVYVFGNSVAKELYGREFKTGETLEFSWYDGTRRQRERFTIAGIIDKDASFTREGYMAVGPAGFFVMPEDLLEELMPAGFNTCRSLMITSDWPKSEKAVTAQLEKLVEQNGKLYLDTLREAVREDEQTWNLLYAGILGLSLFLILFGVINLINTVVTGILSRRQEFAMLESIGMEKRQVIRMIQGEGVILAFYNLLFSLILGSAAGFALIRFMAEHGAPYLHYHFPLWYAAAYAALAVGLPALVSAVCVRSFEKRTIVERLRRND